MGLADDSAAAMFGAAADGMQHTKQIVEQMVANHAEFYKYLVQFKLMLTEQKNVAG